MNKITGGIRLGPGTVIVVGPDGMIDIDSFRGIFEMKNCRIFGDKSCQPEVVAMRNAATKGVM